MAVVEGETQLLFCLTRKAASLELSRQGARCTYLGKVFIQKIQHSDIISVCNLDWVSRDQRHWDASYRPT